MRIQLSYVTRVILTFIVLFFCKLGVAQDVNLIIQINEKLVISELSNIYVTFDTTKITKKYPVEYVPGSLRLSDEVSKLIKVGSLSEIYLFITYNNFEGGNQQTAQFQTKLTRYQLELQYLIWSIYDFRNKKYRKWYQKDKSQESVSELIYLNSGLIIRNR